MYASARCPPGKVAIAGGALSPGPSYLISFSPNTFSHNNTSVLSSEMAASPVVIGSYPNAAFGFASTDWVVQFEIPVPVIGAASWPVQVVAVCAKLN